MANVWISERLRALLKAYCMDLLVNVDGAFSGQKMAERPFSSPFFAGVILLGPSWKAQWTFSI
jgi:hypothetical protein